MILSMCQWPSQGPTARHYQRDDLGRPKEETLWCNEQKRVASGSLNYHMSSGGFTLSVAKPWCSHLFFFLVYRSEAILLAIVMWQSSRAEMNQEGKDNEARSWSYSQSKRPGATLCYLQGVWRYHDYNVHERSFNIRDQVPRSIQNESGLHKVNSRWEGPFLIFQVTRPR